MLGSNRRSLLAFGKLCPQLRQLLLHLGILVPLPHTPEIGINLTVEPQTLAAFATNVLRLLDDIAPELGPMSVAVVPCSLHLQLTFC